MQSFLPGELGQKSNEFGLTSIDSGTPAGSDDDSRQKSEITGLVDKFEKHAFTNAVLKNKQLQLALWKRDGIFFICNLRDCDENGVIKNKIDGDSRKCCPYVAWFDSTHVLLEHIWPNLNEAGKGVFELILFKLQTKVENSNSKSWYNFSPVDDMSNQWIIRSLYGSLQNQFGICSCIIALAFASTLQPCSWNSSMIDSALKYGTRLYKNSLKKNSSEFTLDAIVTPFIIGCYEYSFTAGLFKCGANERNVLENGVTSLFNHSAFAVISSKGYSAAIWQQNNSYFIFDPNLDGMASLSRFSNIALISEHFLERVRTGMTGVNVFEIFKVTTLLQPSTSEQYTDYISIRLRFPRILTKGKTVPLTQKQFRK